MYRPAVKKQRKSLRRVSDFNTRTKNRDLIAHPTLHLTTISSSSIKTVAGIQQARKKPKTTVVDWFNSQADDFYAEIGL